jgi:uncharacterized repeat protein (TIGR01451 family)
MRTLPGSIGTTGTIVSKDLPSFFQDFRKALNDYLSNSVTVSLDFNLASDNVPPATPSAVNVGEVWRFKIRVANTGELNMTNVRFFILGESGTTVSASPTVGFAAHLLTPSQVPSAVAVPANGPEYVSDYFYFKAPAVSSQVQEPLVKVAINNFDVNLDHLLTGDTAHANDNVGTIDKQVWP